MHTDTQTILTILHTLSPEKIAEVKDFTLFLQARYGITTPIGNDTEWVEEDKKYDFVLQHAARKLSENSFAKVWDNSEDAIYDQL